jgi:hypothetical protein
MPDWLIDGSANKFNNTYFRDAHGKGFAVDMSGDLIVRGGLSLPLGTIQQGNGNKILIEYDGTSPLTTTDYGGMSGLNGFQQNAPITIRKTDYGSYGMQLEMGHYSDTGDFYIQNEMSNVGARDICFQPYAGNVGIGTTTPHAKFQVSGGSGSIGYGLRSMFRYDYNIVDHNSNIYHDTDFGIYANHAIACQSYILSHSTFITASDIRIKNNITDVQDDSALTMLRALKPKTYGYNDVMNRGAETVYGFVAQEVGEIIPQSVQKRQDSIPNIYQLVTVGDDNKTLCFYQGFNTQNLDASSNTLKILDKETNENFVNIEEIIDASYIRVDTDLSNMMGDIDASDNVVEGNKVFVYGQRVDDFHFLKKDAIWTVATAALQEVDRQLQAEKAKTATLESQVAALLAKYPL